MDENKYCLVFYIAFFLFQHNINNGNKNKQMTHSPRQPSLQLLNSKNCYFPLTVKQCGNLQPPSISYLIQALLSIIGNQGLPNSQYPVRSGSTFSTNQGVSTRISVLLLTAWSQKNEKSQPDPQVLSRSKPAWRTASHRSQSTVHSLQRVHVCV